MKITVDRLALILTFFMVILFLSAPVNIYAALFDTGTNHGYQQLGGNGSNGAVGVGGQGGKGGQGGIFYTRGGKGDDGGTGGTGGTGGAGGGAQWILDADFTNWGHLNIGGISGGIGQKGTAATDWPQYPPFYSSRTGYIGGWQGGAGGIAIGPGERGYGEYGGAGGSTSFFSSPNGGNGGGGGGSGTLGGMPGGAGGKGGVGGLGGSGGDSGSGTVTIESGSRLANTYGILNVNNGSLQVKSGGVLENRRNSKINVDVLGGIEIDAGAEVYNNGSIQLTNGKNLINNGTFSGFGIVDGNFINNGFLKPGNSPGMMTIIGNYTENSSLFIELGGLNDFVPEYDYLDIIGNVILGSGSLLNLDFYGTFDERMLSEGDFFDIIRYNGSLTGSFGGIDDVLAQLALGSWNIDYHFTLDSAWSSVRLSYTANPVPVPGSLWLLASGVLGLINLKRKY